MQQNCLSCKFGADRDRKGKKPPAGTVFCLKKGMPMGKNRQLACYSPPAGMRAGRCRECRHAKTLKSDGQAPKAGHVWCEKRKFEINKTRHMDCFTR